MALIKIVFPAQLGHEACGHLLETTSVAKKASVFHDKMGEMVAHTAVNAVDDGITLFAKGKMLLSVAMFLRVCLMKQGKS